MFTVYRYIQGDPLPAQLKVEYQQFDGNKKNSIQKFI